MHIYFIRTIRRECQRFLTSLVLRYLTRVWLRFVNLRPIYKKILEKILSLAYVFPKFILS